MHQWPDGAVLRKLNVTVAMRQFLANAQCNRRFQIVVIVCYTGHSSDRVLAVQLNRAAALQTLCLVNAAVFYANNAGLQN